MPSMPITLLLAGRVERFIMWTPLLRGLRVKRNITDLRPAEWATASVCGQCASPPRCPLCPAEKERTGKDMEVAVATMLWKCVQQIFLLRFSPWSWCWRHVGSSAPPEEYTSHSDKAALVCLRSPGWTVSYSSPAKTHTQHSVTNHSLVSLLLP